MTIRQKEQSFSSVRLAVNKKSQTHQPNLKIFFRSLPKLKKSKFQGKKQQTNKHTHKKITVFWSSLNHGLQKYYMDAIRNRLQFCQVLVFARKSGQVGIGPVNKEKRNLLYFSDKISVAFNWQNVIWMFLILIPASWMSRYQILTELSLFIWRTLDDIWLPLEMHKRWLLVSSFLSLSTQVPQKMPTVFFSFRANELASNHSEPSQVMDPHLCPHFQMVLLYFKKIVQR